MTDITTYYHINRIAEEREIAQKVLENDKAVVVYFEIDGKYMAIEKATSGKEYTFSGLYHRSTRGDFKRCKKAFEKYSGIQR